MVEVYKITGYTGTKAGDIDKMSSTEDDSGILNNYFEEAIGALSDIIASYGVIDMFFSNQMEGLDYFSDARKHILANPEYFKNRKTFFQLDKKAAQ
ncbi:MAG: hypothetical protein LUI85_10870 [Bacteroides sp.]|nr:hypothetical protein [Bacteroides sp.]